MRIKTDDNTGLSIFDYVFIFRFSDITVNISSCIYNTKYWLTCVYLTYISINSNIWQPPYIDLGSTYPPYDALIVTGLSPNIVIIGFVLSSIITVLYKVDETLLEGSLAKYDTVYVPGTLILTSIFLVMVTSDSS